MAIPEIWLSFAVDARPIAAAEIALARRGPDEQSLEPSRVGEPKAVIDPLHSFG